MAQQLKNSLRKFLVKKLNNFVDNVDENQIEMNIWDGNVELKDLQLKPLIFDSLPVPIQIISGHIKKLCVNLPWPLFNAPVKFEASNVEVILSVIDDNLNDINNNTTAISELALASKRRRLRNADEVIISREYDWMSNEDERKGMLKDLFAKILHNVIININDLHIRFEASHHNLGRKFAMGIHVDSFTTQTTNELGEPCFIQSNANNTTHYRLIEIVGLGLYWDCDIKQQHHNFLLKPTDIQMNLIAREHMMQDGKALWEVNTSLPSVELKLIHEQFVDIMVQMNYFSMIIRQRRVAEMLEAVQSFRPNVNVHHHAKQWWKYAYLAVKHLKSYGQNTKRTLHASLSLQMIAERRKNRKRYIPLFKRSKNVSWLKSLDKNEIELLKDIEDQLNIEDILWFRELAYRELEMESKKKKKIMELKSKQAQQRSLAASFWAIVSGDEVKVSEQDVKLTPEQLAELYGEVSLSEAVEAQEIPLDYISTVIDVDCRHFNIILCNNKNDSLVELKTSCSWKLSLRPSSQSMLLNLMTDRFMVTDLIHSSYATILSTNDKEWLNLSIESNPIHHDTDLIISLTAKPTTAILQKPFFDMIQQFFRIPNEMAYLSSVTQSFVQYQRSKFLNSLTNHSSYAIDILFDALALIIPSNSINENDPIISASLGKFCLDSETFESTLAKYLNKPSDIDMYDTYQLKLDDMNCLIWNSYDDYLQNNTNYSFQCIPNWTWQTQLSRLKRIMKVTNQQEQVVNLADKTNFILPDIIICAQIKQFLGRMSPKHVHLIISIWQQWTNSNNITMLEELKEDTSKNVVHQLEFYSQFDDKKNNNNEQTNNEQEILLPVLHLHFVTDLVQWHFIDSTDTHISTLNASNCYVDMNMNNLEQVFNIRLGNFSITMPNMKLPLIEGGQRVDSHNNSDDMDSSLLKLRVYMPLKQHKMYLERQADNIMDIELARWYLNWIPSTVNKLVIWSNQCIINSVSSMNIDDDQALKNNNNNNNDNVEISDDMANTDVTNIPLVKVNFKWQGLKIILYSSELEAKTFTGKQILEATMDTTVATLLWNIGRYDFSGKLGNVMLTDRKNDKQFYHMLRVKDSKRGSVLFLNMLMSQNSPPIIKVKMESVEIIYVHSFVQELVEYMNTNIMNVLVPQIEEFPADYASFAKLDIMINTPLLIIPQNRYQSYGIVAKLGQLTVTNHLNQNDNIDEMKVTLNKMGLGINPMNTNNLQYIFDEFSVVANVHRNLNNNNLDVSLYISILNMIVNSGQLNFFLTTLQQNFVSSANNNNNTNNTNTNIQNNNNNNANIQNNNKNGNLEENKRSSGINDIHVNAEWSSFNLDVRNHKNEKIALLKITDLDCKYDQIVANSQVNFIGSMNTLHILDQLNGEQTLLETYNITDNQTQAVILSYNNIDGFGCQMCRYHLNFYPMCIKELLIFFNYAVPKQEPQSSSISIENDHRKHITNNSSHSTPFNIVLDDIVLTLFQMDSSKIMELMLSNTVITGDGQSLIKGKLDKFNLKYKDNKNIIQIVNKSKEIVNFQLCDKKLICTLSSIQFLHMHKDTMKILNYVQNISKYVFDMETTTSSNDDANVNKSETQDSLIHEIEVNILNPLIVLPSVYINTPLICDLGQIQVKQVSVDTPFVINMENMNIHYDNCVLIENFNIDMTLDLFENLMKFDTSIIQMKLNSVTYEMLWLIYFGNIIFAEDSLDIDMPVMEKKSQLSLVLPEIELCITCDDENKILFKCTRILLKSIIEMNKFNIQFSVQSIIMNCLHPSNDQIQFHNILPVNTNTQELKVNDNVNMLYVNMQSVANQMDINTGLENFCLYVAPKFYEQICLFFLSGYLDANNKQQSNMNVWQPNDAIKEDNKKKRIVEHIEIGQKNLKINFKNCYFVFANDLIDHSTSSFVISFDINLSYMIISRQSIEQLQSIDIETIRLIAYLCPLSNIFASNKQSVIENFQFKAAVHSKELLIKNINHINCNVDIGEMLYLISSDSIQLFNILLRDIQQAKESLVNITTGQSVVKPVVSNERLDENSIEDIEILAALYSPKSLLKTNTLATNNDNNTADILNLQDLDILAINDDDHHAKKNESKSLTDVMKITINVQYDIKNFEVQLRNAMLSNQPMISINISANGHFESQNMVNELECNGLMDLKYRSQLYNKWNNVCQFPIIIKQHTSERINNSWKRILQSYDIHSIHKETQNHQYIVNCVVPVCKYRRLWYLGDRFKPSFSIWRPESSDDKRRYLPFGDVISLGKNTPKFPTLLCHVESIEARGIMAFPIDYQYIWNDKGTWASTDCTIWRPIPPNENYVSLGLLCEPGHDKPSIKSCVCVHKKYLETCNLQFLWRDSQMLAHKPISVWQVDNDLATFFLVNVNDRPSMNIAYKMKISSSMKNVLHELQKPNEQITSNIIINIPKQLQMNITTEFLELISTSKFLEKSGIDTKDRQLVLLDPKLIVENFSGHNIQFELNEQNINNCNDGNSIQISTANIFLTYAYINIRDLNIFKYKIDLMNYKIQHIENTPIMLNVKYDNHQNTIVKLQSSIEIQNCHKHLDFMIQFYDANNVIIFQKHIISLEIFYVPIFIVNNWSKVTLVAIENNFKYESVVPIFKHEQKNIEEIRCFSKNRLPIEFILYKDISNNINKWYIYTMFKLKNYLPFGYIIQLVDFENNNNIIKELSIATGESIDLYHITERVGMILIFPTTPSVSSTNSNNNNNATNSTTNNDDDNNTNNNNNNNSNNDNNNSNNSNKKLSKTKRRKMKKYAERYDDEDMKLAESLLGMQVTTNDDENDNKDNKDDKNTEDNDENDKDLSEHVCFNCGQLGHIFASCPNRKDTNKTYGQARRDAKAVEEAELQELMAEEHLAIKQDEKELSELDHFTGKPLATDNFMYPLVMCAPLSAINDYKYKIKLVPGSTKRGKAAKSILEMFTHQLDSSVIEKNYIKSIPDQSWSDVLLSNVKVTSLNANKHKGQKGGGNHKKHKKKKKKK